jgi:predicted small metal-binding protein
VERALAIIGGVALAVLAGKPADLNVLAPNCASCADFSTPVLASAMPPSYHEARLRLRRLATVGMEYDPDALFRTSRLAGGAPVDGGFDSASNTACVGSKRRARCPHRTCPAKESIMTRKYIDCREFPSDTQCSVAISADSEEELLQAAVDHAVSVHHHSDSPELRQQLRQLFKDGMPPEHPPLPAQAGKAGAGASPAH